MVTRDKVKISLEHEGGVPGVRLRSTQQTSILEPEKRIKDSVCSFFSQVYIAYNYLVDAVVSCFNTPFLSSGDYLLLSSKKKMWIV